MNRLHITEIHFRDIYGKLLWKEPMILSRLFAIGDEIVENRQDYVVRRIAVASTIEHVNIEKL